MYVKKPYVVNKKQLPCLMMAGQPVCCLLAPIAVHERNHLPAAPCVEGDWEEAVLKKDAGFCIGHFLGKVCDVSMNSFRYSVLRNVQIVGMTGNMVCFISSAPLRLFLC